MAVTGDAIFEIHEAQAVAEETPKALYRIRILPFENTSANRIAQYGLVTFQFVNVEDYMGIRVISSSFERKKMKLIKPATSTETVQHYSARISQNSQSKLKKKRKKSCIIFQSLNK